MTFDLTAAVAFTATHARLLDRRRLDLALGPYAPDDGNDGDRDDAVSPDGVLAALDAHRNPDGGYGWGLEPDLRAAESQPAAAMHALEVLAEVGPVASPRAAEVFDWLDRHTLADGGLPFVLPINDPTGCAPWWAAGDPTTSSLQMTAQVAARAHLVARHDPDVARHPWLDRATAWCLDAVRAMDARPHAYELLFALQFLDAATATVPEAGGLLDRLAAFLPPDGALPVEGGAEGETLRPLDVAPVPDRPVRRLFSPEVIAADLDRLDGDQQPDGGWVVDF
ncbi:MAG: hypothetical protein JXA83_09285, partial [Acidimicrobiales bacterium]|nr:hypothetical protein [Acidimicrobiales bacterium]